MPRDLILIALSLFTWGMGEGLFFYFIPLSLQEWGADPFRIGIIYSGIGIAITLAQIPVGILSDRIGSRYIMWASWSIGMIAAWIMALAGSLNVFILGLWVYYLTAFVMAPMNGYITRAKGNLRTERALTFVAGMFNLGSIAGPLTGGFIADKYGLRAIYLISAIIFIISTLIILNLHAQPVEERPQKHEKSNLLKNSRFVSFLVFTFLSVVILYFPQSLASNYLQNEKGLSLTQIGMLGAVGGIGNAFATLFLGSFTALTAIFLGQAMMMVYAFLLWKGNGMPFYMLGYFLLGGYRLIRAMFVGFSRPLVHARELGLAYGILETVTGLAVIIAPGIAGMLFSRQPALIFSVTFFSAFFLLIFSLVILPLINKNVKPEM
jgi:MFS family permease